MENKFFNYISRKAIVPILLVSSLFGVSCNYSRGIYNRILGGGEGRVETIEMCNANQSGRQGIEDILNSERQIFGGLLNPDASTAVASPNDATDTNGATGGVPSAPNSAEEGYKKLGKGYADLTAGAPAQTNCKKKKCKIIDKKMPAVVYNDRTNNTEESLSRASVHVKRGDTLWGLAKLYYGAKNIIHGIATIINANELEYSKIRASNGNYIQAGWNLRVPEDINDEAKVYKPTPVKSKKSERVASGKKSEGRNANLGRGDGLVNVTPEQSDLMNAPPMEVRYGNGRILVFDSSPSIRPDIYISQGKAYTVFGGNVYERHLEDHDVSGKYKRSPLTMAQFEKLKSSSGVLHIDDSFTQESQFDNSAVPASHQAGEFVFPSGQTEPTQGATNKHQRQGSLERRIYNSPYEVKVAAFDLETQYMNQSGRAAKKSYVDSRAAQVQYFKSQGYSVAELAEAYGKSKTTIYRDLNRTGSNVVA